MALIVKMVFVEELMRGVPQLDCKFSGHEGFAAHLMPPYTT